MEADFSSDLAAGAGAETGCCLLPTHKPLGLP